MEDDLRTGTPYRILVCVSNPLVLTGGVTFGQSEGIPDSGIPERLPLRKFHRRSLVPSPSLPSFSFPLFRSLYFSLALHHLNAWNRLADVYEEFKEQLTRSAEGWYETSLPWKGNHPTLPNNKAGSLKRLENTVRKLEKQGLLEQYDAIIKEQLAEGIVEPAEEQAVGREFYIPHKPVIRESAESTKLRIVYDASARAFDKAPSLNDCLHTGPPLQNQLWSVMVRARFHPVLTTGDMRQAFLQVRIHTQDRDAMRFHWIADLETRRVETLRFTRALFGLSSSPFLLGGVI